MNIYERKNRMEALGFAQQKATSEALGYLPKELVTHENAFDWDYQEAQYQWAREELERLPGVEKIVIEEPGCEPLVAYRIGEPNAIMTAHIHGDEPGPAVPMFIQLVELIRQKHPAMQNILIVPRAYAEAYQQKRRGVALDQELFDRLQTAGILRPGQLELITSNGQIDLTKFAQLLSEQGYHVTTDGEEFYIDLNRQFIERADRQTPDSSLLFPKARQLLRAYRELAPNAQQGFSFHADNLPTTARLNEVGIPIRDENGDLIEDVPSGCYLYDTPKTYAGQGPTYEAQVKDCINKFIAAMKARGIPLLDGMDDANDPDLGIRFVDGYAMAPAWETKENGQIVAKPQDKTWETSLPRWFEPMQRYWCFETAGWINPDRREEMIAILLKTLVIPLLLARDNP